MPHGDTLIHSVHESESRFCAIVATLPKLGRKSRTGFDPYCGCSFPRAGHHKLAGRACGSPSHRIPPIVQSRLPGTGDLRSEGAIPTSMRFRNRGVNLKLLKYFLRRQRQGTLRLKPLFFFFFFFFVSSLLDIVLRLHRKKSYASSIIT